MSIYDHQQAARIAVMNSVRQIEPNLYQNPHDPELYYGGLADDMIAAATPHLRAAWEQELAEKIRAEAEKIRVAQLAANKGYLPLTIVALLGGYGQAAALLEGGAE